MVNCKNIFLSLFRSVFTQSYDTASDSLPLDEFGPAEITTFSGQTDFIFNLRYKLTMKRTEKGILGKQTAR